MIYKLFPFFSITILFLMFPLFSVFQSDVLFAPKEQLNFFYNSWQNPHTLSGRELQYERIHNVDPKYDVICNTTNGNFHKAWKITTFPTDRGQWNVKCQLGHSRQYFWQNSQLQAQKKCDLVSSFVLKQTSTDWDFWCYCKNQLTTFSHGLPSYRP